MAKVKRTFMLSLSPEQAQQQFVEHVVPSLHRLGDFVRSHEEPGLIAFTDGIRDPVDFPNSGGGDYVLLRRMTAHRLKVTFEAEGVGTRVSIRGGATRDVRRAINRLGMPAEAH
jgi:hypothetical protein